MDTSLRNRIRHRLSSLQSDNGETLFEQVCSEVARRRIHANIKMSSFVAGHGDKGRDFENVPGNDPRLVGPLGQEDELRPDDTIVGACTLGRSDPPSKIRGDVQTIHNKGPQPKIIYYFCETDFATTTQIDLRNWSEQTFGTRLHILTGNTLSEWLSEADLAAALNLLGLTALPTPRCVLPPIDTEGFVGRRNELELLSKSLSEGDFPVGGRIIGLYGPPGVGKSGLAVHFARLNRNRFPDGVIGVDLRGVDDPIDALSRLAVAMGEPLTDEEQAWPPHQIAQSRLAHLQCLILLDNLEHGSTLKQIRPGGWSAVLITCRDQDVLAKFAVPAEHWRPVERLPRAEAIAYLQSALGSATHNPDEFGALADALWDLPLALRIGARRVMEDPVVSGRIERFVARLRSPTRIGELSVAGEADLDLVRLFDLSLERLSDGERRAFACLSVCAAKGFGARAAAAAMNRPDPMPLVARLARLSLLEVDQPTSRFRFHAVVDDYARHLADLWGLAPAARARHAQAMANLLRDSADVQGPDLVELLADQEDIRHGLEHFADTGHVDIPLLQGLTRLVEQTALGDWHSSLLVRLRERLAPDSRTWIGGVLLLQQGKRDLALGRLEEARTAFERSLEISIHLKDQGSEARVLNSLGGVLRDLGRLEEAYAAFERSLEISRALSNQCGEAMVLNSLGGVLRDLGRLEKARAAFERSLEIFGALNYQRGQAMVLNSLGGVLRDLGCLEEARASFEQSLELDRALNNKRGEARVLNSLGGVLRDLVRLEEARVAFERSLKIGRALNDQRHEAKVLNSLGGVLRDFGRLEESCAAFERSLEIGRALNDQRHEARVLNSLGGVLRDLGRLEEAQITFERSLEIRRALNDQRGEGMVLNSLGGVLRKLDQLEEARAAFERSLEIGRVLNVPRHEAMVLNGLGGVLRDLGWLEEARAAFERSLEIGRALSDLRHEARVLNSLGGVLRALGRQEEAYSAFERSLDIGCTLNDRRHEAMVLNSLGGLLCGLGRLEEACSAIERSLNIDLVPNNQRSKAMVLNRLGGLLRNLGRLEKARAAIDRSLEILRALNDQRGVARVLNSLGGILRDLGRLEEACAAFERSLEISRALNDQRHEARMLNRLGWLYREMGDPSAALDFLNAQCAISKGLRSPAPASFKAELKVLRKWSRQLATRTHTLAAYHLVMEKRRASGQDWHGAIIHMRRNLVLDWEGPEQRLRTERLSYAYFRAQRLPEATAAYRSALEIGPLSPVGYANFGRALHLAGGDLKEAEEYLRRACQLQPDNAWASSWLGLLLSDTGQMDEGEQKARQALVGYEGKPVLLHNLAQVLARFPDNRRDKLQEALDTCTRANAAADFPFYWLEDLARELRQRLGYPEADTPNNTRAPMD